MQITTQQIQVLIAVLQRAPMSLAEQLVCNHVVDEVVQQIAPAPAPAPNDADLLARLLATAPPA